MAKGTQTKVDLPEGWWESLLDLVTSLWAAPPEDRPILQHKRRKTATEHLDIYKFIGLSQSLIVKSQKKPSKMTLASFRKLSRNIGYDSHKDLLQELSDYKKLANISTPTKPPHSWARPPDLAPPPFNRNFRRSFCMKRLDELYLNFFAVVIQGPLSCGKSALALDLMDQETSGNVAVRLLWFPLQPDAVLGHVLERIKMLGLPFTARPGQETADLISWLHSENAIIVLDGLDEHNATSFRPFLQLCSRLDGPARVIATTSIKLSGGSAYEVPPLTVDELMGMASNLGADARAVGEFPSIVGKELWPNTLEKALALFGSVNILTVSKASTLQMSDLKNRLSDDDQCIVDALISMGMDFDLPALGLIIKDRGLKEAPDAVACRLQSMFMIRQTSALEWRVLQVGREEVAKRPNDPEHSALLLKLSYHYEDRALIGGRFPIEPSIVDLNNWYNACRLAQLANGSQSRRNKILGVVAKGMEPLGFHERLHILYEFEASVSSGTFDWVHFKLARSLRVTGRLMAMQKICDNAFHFLQRNRKDRDENLYISFLREISHLLIDLGKGTLALRILDGALEACEMAELSSIVGVQTVSVLGLALLASGMTKEYIDLHERVLNRPFGGLIQPFSAALSQTRQGIAFIDQKKYPEAIVVLAEAMKFFGQRDARAFAWSSLYLAEAYRAVGSVPKAREALQQSIDTSATRNLFAPDLGALASAFLSNSDYSDLHPIIQTELDRSKQYYSERSSLSLSISESRLIEHIFLELDIELGDVYEYDASKYELFSIGRPYAIKSAFNQNLICRIGRDNAEATLDVLFAERQPKHIFHVHIYNRIIVNSCKDIPLLAKKYIYPNLATIFSQMDSVLYVYARHFEGFGADVDLALKLLENVKKRECFNYYNIGANCASRNNFEEAMRLNKIAFSHAIWRQQRAQILHNMANLIFAHKIRSEFELAIEYCEDSIRNTTKDKFFWPKNLLLKLRLTKCDSEGEIKLMLEEHQSRFRVSPESLKRICLELDPGRVKRMSLSVLEAN